MKCMNPILIYYDLDDKKYSYRAPKRWRHDDCLYVPCGKCPACRKEWRTHLAQRMRYELNNYNDDEKCFITLTCDSDHIDEVFPNDSLNHEYFKKFIKKLRRHLEYHKIPHKPLKYLVSGEYGTHNTHRPHFHMILMGFKPSDLREKLRKSKKGYTVYESDLLADKWGAGYVEVGNVSEHTAPYMVKYMVKYSEAKKIEKYYENIIIENIDEETGEYFEHSELIEKRRHCFKKPTVVGVDDNGNYIYEIIEVRAPYVVYPKKILGIDYFIQNYRQILRNGFIFDSKGNKHGIPRSFKKWCEKITENCDEKYYDIIKEYNEYKVRIELALEEELAFLKSLGLKTAFERLNYYKEQGAIKRLNYETFKNKYR